MSNKVQLKAYRAPSEKPFDDYFTSMFSDEHVDVVIPHSTVWYARAWLASNENFLRDNNDVIPTLAQVEQALYELDMLPSSEKRKIERRK